MPAPKPPEFHQRAVELARRREKPIAQIAKDLLNRTGFSEVRFVWLRPGPAVANLMVEGFVLGWTPTAQRGVEATVVPPVDPFQGGQLDLLDAPPGSAAFD